MFWRPPRLRNDGHERLRGAESRWTTRHERTDHATSSDILEQRPSVVDLRVDIR
jgi:hypothetical protein